MLLPLCVTAAVLGGCVPEQAGRQPEIPKEEKRQPEQEVLTELPRAYSGEKVPVLRDQQETNNCWAFASLSALEASKDEDAGEIYSPDHLIYHNPFQREFSEGGSYLVTTAYLLSWYGPVREADDPFDGKSDGNVPVCAHVQEIRLSEGKDYEAIKRFVYLYGGVETAVYFDFDENMEKYYREDTSSYCYLGAESSNHDIVIIGWDDDYPAENFAGDVARDGAFCAATVGENVSGRTEAFMFPTRMSISAKLQLCTAKWSRQTITTSFISLICAGLRRRRATVRILSG